MNSRLMLTMLILSLLGIMACSPPEVTQPTQSESVSTTISSTSTSIELTTTSNPEPTKSELDILEVEQHIWGSLGGWLPQGWSSDDLVRDQLKVKYQGDGEWSFSIFGYQTESHNLLPEIEEESDIHWIKYYKKEHTTHKLDVTGIYYEERGLLDVSVEQPYIDETDIEIMLQEEYDASFLYHGWVYVQKDYIYDFTVENLSEISLSKVRIKFTYGDYQTNEIVQNGIESDNFSIEATKTIRFRIIVPNSQVKSTISFRDAEIEFYSSSGLVIPSLLTSGD